MMTRDAI